MNVTSSAAKDGPEDLPFARIGVCEYTRGEMAPAASKEAVFAIGVGANVIWVEPTRGMVVVVTWLEKGALGRFVEGVLG